MSEITLAIEDPSLGYGYGKVIARYDLSEIQKKAYEQGIADALDIDEDSVRFTNEQKAWVKKYIIRQNKARYELGAREFAEWLFKSKYREINMDGFSWYDDKGIDRLESLDKVLSEWQKEVNNA